MDSDMRIQNRVEVDLELLIQHIDAALSATVTDKSGYHDMGDDGMRFFNFVQPATSGFLELLQVRIEDGSKLFSNQKSLSSSTWATDARTVAVDVLRGVSNIHWSAVGLLAVAIVLERLDKMSSNDRECVDLLRGMNDLAKCIKQLQEIKAHLHKEIREKMSDGVFLIITGAMMCCSVIRSKKLSKFMLSTKIREKLNFLRGQVDHMFRDIMLQTQLKILFSCISDTSHQSSLEAPGGIFLQSEKDEAETSSRGQIDRNAISFDSEETHYSQSSYLNHGHSSQIANQRSNNHLKRIISGIVRGIQRSKRTAIDEKYQYLTVPRGIRDLDHYLFQYHEIRIACQDFHPKKKIGEGRFGCVYKGTLADGRQLAIKRVSEQGKRLFVNEWGIGSRLLHRNIAKLLGFCTEGEEILLVYEYIPKGGLLNLRFNPIKFQVLDWRIHLNIIQGVARGLAYLHEDSGICIVHGDLKPDNILIDENLNPKIADFALGAVLDKNGKDQNMPVAGTEGYIAPECKFDGRVTDKMDVFRFGVVVLEIVSGRRHVEFTCSFLGLVKWAWDLHEENRHLDLVDSRLIWSETFDPKIVLRVILIALQCTQEVTLRPSMSKVSFLLSLPSEEISLPTLTKPDYLYNS